MLEIFEKAEIFQACRACMMEPNFLGDLISRPTDVGRQKDKDLETVELSAGHKILFQQLCKGEDEQE